jgi:hypothetical protein
MRKSLKRLEKQIPLSHPDNWPDVVIRVPTEGRYRVSFGIEAIQEMGRPIITLQDVKKVIEHSFRDIRERRKYDDVGYRFPGEWVSANPIERNRDEALTIPIQFRWETSSKRAVMDFLESTGHNVKYDLDVSPEGVYFFTSPRSERQFII